MSRIAQQPAMRRLLQEEVARGADKQDAALKKEITQLKTKIADSEKKMERWADAFSRGVMAEAQFVKYSRKMQESARGMGEAGAKGATGFPTGAGAIR